MDDTFEVIGPILRRINRDYFYLLMLGIGIAVSLANMDRNRKIFYITCSAFVILIFTEFAVILLPYVRLISERIYVDRFYFFLTINTINAFALLLLLIAVYLGRKTK